jgi:hypothetical protein
MPDRKVLQPHEHDCDGCIWVGWIETNYGWGNIYFHPSTPKAHVGGSKHGTIIIRYSSEPSDYWSMPVHSGSTKGAIDLGPFAETEIRDIGGGHGDVSL